MLFPVNFNLITMCDLDSDKPYSFNLIENPGLSISFSVRKVGLKAKVGQYFCHSRFKGLLKLTQNPSVHNLKMDADSKET